METAPTSLNNHDRNIHNLLMRLREFTCNPYSEWAIMVVVCFFLAIFLSGFGYFTYKNVYNIVSDGSSTAFAGQRQIFDPQELNAVLQKFDDRAKEHELLLRGEYPISRDPSL